MLDKPSIFIFKLTSEIVKGLNYRGGGGVEPVNLLTENSILRLCWKTGNCTTSHGSRGSVLSGACGERDLVTAFPVVPFVLPEALLCVLNKTAQIMY